MLATILIDENSEGRIVAEDLKVLGIAPKSRVEAEIIVKEIDPPHPLEIPPNKTLQDILDEYEAKYGMTSAECSRKLENDEIDETLDLLRWMGFYRLAQSTIADGEDPAEMKFTLYYDDPQPRPNDPSRASISPYHRHIPPDLKHHRVPAPGLSFDRSHLALGIRGTETTWLS